MKTRKRGQRMTASALATAEAAASAREDQGRTLAPNETPVRLMPPDLHPYLKVVKAARPSITYERME